MKRRVALLLVGLTLTPGLLSADGDSSGLFLHGTVSRNFEPAAVDPAFPKGPMRGDVVRPRVSHTSCSPRRPVCVHTSSGVAFPVAFLRQLEAAYDAVVLALRLPPPLPDARGGSPALDVYVSDGHSPLTVRPDSTPARGAEAAAFCSVGVDAVDDGAALRCVAGASSYRLDSSETPGLRGGLSTHYAWLAQGPDRTSLEAVDLAQANPQVGLLTREADGLSPAAALFWSHLEHRFGSGRPGELTAALFGLSRPDRDDPGLTWHNEPDVLDVLRNAFDNDAQRFADAAIEFAVGRLFLGNRSDGRHQPGLPWLGTLGRVRFDWSIAYDSLPRNLASPRALEPFGSTYVWLGLDGIPPDAELGVSFTWEAPVRFKWNVVALDDQGNEVKRYDVPYVTTGQHVERSLRRLDGARSLVFVGINLGGVDAEHPFDPDHQPWEPHAYQLYVTTF